MTDGKALQLRLQLAWDKLGWGFSDLRRRLVESGFWPAAAIPAIAPGGACWSVFGHVSQNRDDKRKASALLVPQAQCLQGELSLPELPRNRLPQAMDEALWRLSPLTPEQVVFAWHAMPQLKGGWSVHWVLSRKDRCEEAMAAHGLTPQSPIYMQRGDATLPARGPTLARVQKRQRWGDGLWLAGLLLMLAALSAPALMPLALKRQAVVRAVQHIEAVTPQAAPLRQQVEELRAHAAVIDQLRKGMQTSVPLAEVVEHLAAQLPDDTWLDRLDVNGNEIRLMGLTGNAGNLMAQLSRQPVFADVRSSGASVRDNALNKERFTFDMRWRSREETP